MKFNVFSLLLVLLFSSCQPEKIKIDYFGQTPPEKVPKIFAPDFICLEDRFESKGSFSPDGKAFYFTVTGANFTGQKIFYTELEDKKWTTPDTAIFSRRYSNHEPFISYDGQKLYFSSNREGDTIKNQRDLFVVEKQGKSWTEPLKLNSPINSGYLELLFNQSKSGTVYFTSNRPGGIGEWDIYYTKENNGRYEKLENIGSPINEQFAWDPCIGPDESYLIFGSWKEDCYGESDLYVSFKNEDGWTKPKNLGNLINTEANEFGPFLSPDNKYLFFCRHDGKKGDIYWVDLSIVEDLREAL